MEIKIKKKYKIEKIVENKEIINFQIYQPISCSPKKIRTSFSKQNTYYGFFQF